MGKYGSKWLGDNFSRIEYLGYSVTGVMFMNIFGIPLVGADICGFTGIPEDELCARWTVVGSFYPFSRNHNYYYSTNQEPYAYNTTYYEEG
jgi:alpha-glucosidase (family GH31 glycosyl hydrolase)